MLMLFVLPVIVFLYCIMWTDCDLRDAIRNSMIMCGLCVLMCLPVGKWEDREVMLQNPVSSEYLYVIPCEHHLEGGGHMVHITPPYTSYLGLIFNSDDIQIVYCDKCHTRKDAINKYISQR